jgi:hypothetical protein
LLNKKLLLLHKILKLNIMYIANPLYDVVFKYMLEDERVAKTFISAIIGEKIEELTFGATEHTVKKNKKDDDIITLEGSLTVCRFDFCAKIKTETGFKTVTIELQKAKVLSDIVRFRKYLGKQYENPDSILDRDENKARQIYLIYFLNYGINLPDSPVIAVDYKAKDVTTGKELNFDNEFIKSLHHKSWIVQVRQIKERRRNDLEKLLSLFDQDSKEQLQHFLNIDDDEMPDEYQHIIRRLCKAYSDAKLEGAMELEDDFLDELARKERLTAEIQQQNEKMKIENEKIKLESEKMKTESEKMKNESEKMKLESEKMKIELENFKIELEKKEQEIAKLKENLGTIPPSQTS